MKKVVLNTSLTRVNASNNNVERLNMLIGMIGTNRTGKTSVTRTIIEKWIESRPDQTVIAFDPQNQFNKLVNIYIDPTDTNWAEMCLEHPNSLVVLDDYRALHQQNTPQPGLVKLMHFRNFKNIDIIYVTHNPKLVLNALAYYTTQYYIFLTQAQSGSFESKIPNYEQCMAASKMVNRYVQDNGRGEYPNFPYVVVDNESGSIKAFNMRKEKLNLK